MTNICVKCEHFHNRSKPIRIDGLVADSGFATCDKYDLVIDYVSTQQINKLRCVEGSEGRMTQEEAQNIIINLTDFHSHTFAEEKEAIRKAYDALEKQIPKKPHKEPYEKNEGYSATCPSCTLFGARVGVYRWNNYCPVCGQKLDWGDEE